MYVRQLLELIVERASSQRRTLADLYDPLMASLRSLESLGVTTDQNAVFLYPMVESSLPDDVLQIWQRRPEAGYQSGDNTGEPGSSQRLSNLLKFIKEEIRGAERLEFVRAGFKRPEKMQEKQEIQRRTSPIEAHLLNKSNNESCAFCDMSNHTSRNCNRAKQMTLEQRRQKATRAKICFRCLGRRHMARDCRSKFKCFVCGGRHVELMCSGRRQEIHENKADVREDNLEAPSTSMANQACSSEVLLMITALYNQANGKNNGIDSGQREDKSGKSKTNAGNIDKTNTKDLPLKSDFIRGYGSLCSHKEGGEGYTVTEANYTKAIEALQEKFGDSVLLTEMYVRQLLELIVERASSQRRTLADLYDPLMASLRSLESLGVTTDQNAVFLYPMVESSLPDDVLQIWQRRPEAGYQSGDNTGEPGSSQRLSNLLKFIKEEIRGAERLEFVRAGFKRPEKMQEKQEIQRRTSPIEAHLLNQSNNESCAFCDMSNHTSRNCNRAKQMTLEQRRQKTTRAKVCFRCLGRRHMARGCRSKFKCFVCGGRHVELMCSGRRQEIHENKADVREDNLEAPSTSMANQACSSEVLLMITALYNQANGKNIGIDSGQREDKSGKSKTNAGNIDKTNTKDLPLKSDFRRGYGSLCSHKEGG
ncbi:hypothetical protein LAZ67_15000803, partial [Cordylochernes scorpioides]